jgi:two-component system, NarL family, sensor kinase
MRRLIYGLRPPALDDLGLIPSIWQQAQSQGMADLPVGTKTGERKENRLAFSVEAPAELPLALAAVEVACYRIAQEALTNVARHAQARTCQLHLSVDEVAGALELVMAGVLLTNSTSLSRRASGTVCLHFHPKVRN